MLPKDIVRVPEGSLAPRMVILIIVEQGLPDKVLQQHQYFCSMQSHLHAYQAMELVQSFYVRRIATTILRTNLDLIWCQTESCSFALWDGYTAV